MSQHFVKLVSLDEKRILTYLIDSAAFPKLPSGGAMKLLQETNQALLTSIPSCYRRQVKNNNNSLYE
jgi:hypothetical protein